nr:oxidoreductase [Snuella sedimenti]
MLFFSCKETGKFKPRNFSTVTIEPIYTDSLISIRAIDILDDGSLAFAANNGIYGLYNPFKQVWRTSIQAYDGLKLHFRAIAHTRADFFMLSIGTPALLYKTGAKGTMELVYKEEGEFVFYDAMAFWNDTEGIAVGDSFEGCLSIIVTKDGGQTWTKLPCDVLPKAEENEAAFAASNTNVKVLGNKAWIGTSSGNIYYSNDKGHSWQYVKTPIVQTQETEGIYSIDFYDALNGFGIGGDYTKPEGNTSNKIRTQDGGMTWQVVAQNQEPGYRSCVQYIPNREGKELVVTGFDGIDFSNDSGNTWKHLSDEGFYTIRFLNDSTAYAAGKGRIAKLVFK